MEWAPYKLTDRGTLWCPMEMWLGIAFHVFVWFQIFKGMQAAGELKEMEASMPPTIVATPWAGSNRKSL